MARPLCIDLFCGLGGWTKGFLAEGFEVVGFDIERHRYPRRDFAVDEYPGQLVLQNVLTLHGSQFKDAACIVASPPCQRYSWMAMPFSRGKREAAWQRWERDSAFGDFHLNDLFDACFRIQREASEAAGHHIPMVVENVKGAQPWVGRAQANYGNFYLWGDVRSVGGRIVAAHRVEFGASAVRAFRAQKIERYSDPRRNDGKGAHLTCQVENDRRLYGADAPCGCWDRESLHRTLGMLPGETCVNTGRKVPMNFHEYEKTGQPGRSFQSAAVDRLELGVKSTDGWSGFNGGGSGGSGDDLQGLSKVDGSWSVRGAGKYESRTSARKAASAQIAEIPFELSSWVARCFKPDVAIAQRVC